jgi:hypothetical protein
MGSEREAGSSRLVILNLADPGGIGPVSRVKSGLEAKQRTRPTVTVGDAVVPVFELFEDLRNVDSRKVSDELAAAAVACDQADKIFLCTHGLANDTEHAFAKASGGEALATWAEFGKLLAKLLPSSDKRYNIALVMCYGARTDTYRSSDLDHTGQIPASMLKTSFAYKLFKYLCEKNRKIRMTARTGAVGFDSKTGKSSVEQEAAIDISLDKEEFLRSARTDKIIKDWKAFKDAATAAGMAAQAAGKTEIPSKYKKWSAADQKFRSNPDKATGLFASDVEKSGKAYHQVIAQKNALEQRKAQYQDLGKYGKLVYSKSPDGIMIISKYGNQKDIGPGTVLYSGPLL